MRWFSIRAWRRRSADASHNEDMNLSNINQATEWFQVLQTTDRCQAAVMRLDPGKATGKHAESHQDSEQCLLLLKGVLAAEIGSARLTMNTGDMLIITAGKQHNF